MKILTTKIKKSIKSIGLRIQKHIDDSNISLDMIKPVSHSNIPHWKLLKPDIDTSLSEFKKTETYPLVFKQKLAEFKDPKQTGIDINTDGSKDKNKVVAAAVINKDVLSARLPNEHSDHLAFFRRTLGTRLGSKYKPYWNYI